jgi:hypothetical protein
MIRTPVILCFVLGFGALMIGRLVWTRRNPRPYPCRLWRLLEIPHAGQGDIAWEAVFYRAFERSALSAAPRDSKTGFNTSGPKGADS